MAKKRIVIFGWAGSVHIQRWVKGLSERGHKIKVVSMGGTPLSGIETCIIPRRGKLSYLTQATFAAKEAREFDPDIVHAHYAVGYGWWALRTGFSPTVISVWGSDIVDFPSNLLKRAAVKRILNRADHITATSLFLKETTFQLLPGIESKVSVIPFGVMIPDTIAEFPTPKPVRICYLKALEKKYGPDILLRALAKVRQRIPNITLSLAGQGSMTQLLKQMVTELGIETNVRFVGLIDNKEIYSFIRKHHFMVMPSLMEAFGVAALEVGICGRPVIASRVGGVPEVLVDGQTGLLVPPRDVDKLAAAIIKLAEDNALCRRMGTKGYDFVKQNYNWEKSLDMMEDLYNRLVEVEKEGTTK